MLNPAGHDTPRPSAVDLLDHLDDAARGSAGLAFVDGCGVVSFGRLWADAARTAAELAARSRGGTVAAVLATSPACITTVLGSFRAGLRLVSLPLPPRAADPGRYATDLRRVCADSGADLLLVDDSLRRIVEGAVAIDVVGFDELVEASRRRPAVSGDRPGASLVQFTSGSTSEPRGVILELDHVMANILAMIEVLQPDSGDVSLSWLPLSHDMGLIGMLLTSLVACGPRWVGGSTVALMDPVSFARGPHTWLRACSDWRVTITATPDFGLGVAEAAWRHASAVDLSTLRAVIVGGEPVRVATLEGFARRYAAAGFDERAFCPAYGMAEAALGVALVPPAERWSAIAPEGGTGQVVSCGPPLPGFEVRADSGDVGRLVVDGPSLFTGYLGERPRVGPLRTSDFGFVRDGAVYVTGRVDDVVVVGGRNVHLVDVDAAVQDAPGVGPGRGFAAYGADHGLVAFVEERRDGAVVDPGEVAARVVATAGLRPERVVVVERGGLPRTSSGKPQRRRLLERLDAAGEVGP